MSDTTTAHSNHAHTHRADHSAGAEEHGAIVRDPVCGMEVDTRTAEHKLSLGETSYYFCSARCLEKFRADPDRYLNPSAVTPAPEGEGAVWTCPMHPEIRRNGPGQCPICGMALEPLEPTEEEAPNPELIDMGRRFWVSAAMTLPLVALAMATELFGLHLVPMRTSVWLQLALATPVVLWGGWPFFDRF